MSLKQTQHRLAGSRREKTAGSGRGGARDACRQPPVSWNAAAEDAQMRRMQGTPTAGSRKTAAGTPGDLCGAAIPGPADLTDTRRSSAEFCAEEEGRGRSIVAEPRRRERQIDRRCSAEPAFKKKP